MLLLAAAAAGQRTTDAPDQPACIRRSLVGSATVYGIYGRGFGVAPILGRLGTYRSIDDMAADTAPQVEQIEAANGGKPVVRAIHLIYAMATPCQASGDCLSYLGRDIIARYIEPAAARGWVVVLDSQLGRSNPVEQVRHMIAAGFLRYDNVEVAIDPEFHVVPGNSVPGIPIGSVEAAQVNEAERILDEYVRAENLPTKKILEVHQFGDPAVNDGVPFMIRNKESLRDCPNVDLVIDMDGLGTPAQKVWKYNRITSSRIYPFIRFRGIKVFYRDPGETHGHYDRPPMTIEEVFGIRPIPNGLRMATKPDVLIIA